MKVVFLGSPEFAVFSLEALVNSSHKVCAVITQPDRPAGRGLQPQAPAVKKFAESRGIEVYQPESINAPEVLEWLKEKNPELLSVVAFGEFLGKAILKACKYPPINVHPSMLPDLRGAAPIQWALLRGYRTSGVSTQFMVSKMDAGDVLIQEEVALGENENAQDLHSRLGKIGGEILVRTLNEIESNLISPRKQDENKATFAPLLTKADGQVDWSCSAPEIHNKIRGLFPWPSATTTFLAQKVKILKSKVPTIMDSPQQKLGIGEFLLFGESLFVGTGNGTLEILQLQPEGKRAMLPREFANGIRGKQNETSSNRFGT